MTEILLQGESKGIVYEGHGAKWRECVFEEGGIQGRNERYEFRCDYDLQCCGRACCIPEEATIPLWLLILFIALLGLLLFAILGTLAYLLAKKLKNRPKKQKNVYQTLTNNGQLAHESLDEEKYSSPYGDRSKVHGTNGANGAMDRWRDEYGFLEEQRRAREERERERERERAEREREMERLRREREALERALQARSRRGSSGSDSLVHTRQTIEEEFKSEVRYEREVSDDDDDGYRRYR